MIVLPGKNEKVCKGFSNGHQIQKANRFDEKGHQNIKFKREKSLHFSIGERGRDQMSKKKDGDSVEDVHGVSTLERLLFRKQVLLGQPDSRRQNTDNEEHPIDEFDQAAILTIQTTEFRLNRKRACELRRVQGAIERWEHGTYGCCVACDEPIEKRRLLVVPETEFCLGCKQTLERKEHEYTH